MALSNGISYQIRSTGAGVLTNQLMTNRERREYTAQVINKYRAIVPGKKSTNKHIKKQLEKQLTKIISEQFFHDCHENLLPGTYHFNDYMQGECPDCLVTTNLELSITVTIAKPALTEKSNVH